MGSLREVLRVGLLRRPRRFVESPQEDQAVRADVVDEWAAPDVVADADLFEQTPTDR
jgi:hypothetical protein